MKWNKSRGFRHQHITLARVEWCSRRDARKQISVWRDSFVRESKRNWALSSASLWAWMERQWYAAASLQIRCTRPYHSPLSSVRSRCEPWRNVRVNVPHLTKPRIYIYRLLRFETPLHFSTLPARLPFRTSCEWIFNVERFSRLKNFC